MRSSWRSREDRSSLFPKARVFGKNGTGSSDERSVAQVFERLRDFFLGVHHEMPVGCDRLVQRLDDLHHLPGLHAVFPRWLPRGFLHAEPDAAMTNGVDPGLKEGCSNIMLHDCALNHPHRRKAADPMKKILVLLGIMTSLAILAVLAILLFLDINAHKPKIETAATQALGMEVKIQGKASLRLFPSVGISLADVRLRNRGTDLAELGVLQVSLKLFPLLRREPDGS